MKIPSIIPKVNNSNRVHNAGKRQPYAFQQQQYLNRFELKNPKVAISELLNGTYKLIKNALVMGMAYYVGLFGYEMRTKNYEAFDEAGVITYVEPLQTKFASKREAYEYATKRVQDALNSEEPYEHAVYINNGNNEIMAEFRGDDAEVRTIISFYDRLKLKYYGQGATLIHGHPAYENGVTPPVSQPDFESLCNNEFLSEIVAMDKDGKVSILRKTPYFVPLEEDMLKSLGYDLVQILYDSFEHKSPERYQELMSAFINETDSAKSAEVKQLLRTNVLAQDTTMMTNKKVDEYWKTNAEALGVEYYSNFYEN